MILASEARLTALDFETTEARDGIQGEPWQLGLVSVEHGRPLPDSTFECVFEKPDAAKKKLSVLEQQHALLSGTFQLTGQWPNVKHQLEGVPLIAHNMGTERKILQQAMPLHKFGPWIDTLVLSRAAFPDLHSHKLEDLCDELGITPELQIWFPDREAHDALYDAVAAAYVFSHIVAKEGWKELTLQQLSAVKAKKYYEKKRRDM